MKAANKNYKTNYKGYEIIYAGGVYTCNSLNGYKKAYTLREIKQMIRLQIAQPKFDRLRELGICLGDVFGGRMWHNNNTGEWSLDVSDFAKGFKSLNEFTYIIK